jgi:4-diphosphocytidyl-2-C-methyl-D-erythritol kinase
LTVHGRQPDGYHALESLVVFADVGDRLALRPGREANLLVDGPFAGAITGENLIEHLFGLLLREHPTVQLGTITLTKNLPVAAGIGGGSADVAAAIRLLARANPGAASDSGVDWAALGARLGSDVPVCLAGTPCIMHGRGDLLLPVPGLPTLHLVLVNPQVPVLTDKTARVFRVLNAPAIPGPVEPALTRTVAEAASDRAALLAGLARTGNGMTAAAVRVTPEAADVLECLKAEPGAIYVALSGAGPTCFAVFQSADAAKLAAKDLRAAHPSWWIAATATGGQASHA